MGDEGGATIAGLRVRLRAFWPGRFASSAYATAARGGGSMPAPATFLGSATPPWVRACVHAFLCLYERLRGHPLKSRACGRLPHGASRAGCGRPTSRPGGAADAGASRNPKQIYGDLT